MSLILYSQYFTNVSFGDEYDNFTYSWLFRNGLIPYRDFFTHHFPALIFLGYPLEIIGHSKIIYRTFVMLVTFSFFGFFAFYLKGLLRYSTLIFMLFASYAISFYGGFQFADGTFWAIYIMSGLFLVLGKNGSPFKSWETILFSALVFFTTLSSPMHCVAFIALWGFHLISRYKHKPNYFVKNGVIETKNIIVWILLFFSLFLIYLFVSKSLEEFYLSAIEYNSKYFYFRDNVQLIEPKIADFYLHAVINFFDHIKNLFLIEGQALVVFLRSLKGLIVEPNIQYLRVIWADLYNNFFTFEIFVIYFYLAGLFSLFVNKYKGLTIFLLLFIFLIRLRVPEAIHQAPYYLLSYWLLSVAITVSVKNIYSNNRRLLSYSFLTGLFLVIFLFVSKNMYTFKQTAYNTFPYESSSTVDFIKENTNSADRILVIKSESARVFWETQRMPHGYFVNYFDWYDWSPRLKNIRVKNFSDYNGQYLVMGKDYMYNGICDKSEKWINETVDTIEGKYIPLDSVKSDHVLEKSFSRYDKSYCQQFRHFQ